MRIGIIGTGRIAERFISTALEGIDATVSCVFNPHIDSAARFADKHNIDVYTDSLEELSELIQAVYIASPHETHYEYCKYMLEHGIHVLCEKPMALKESEAQELFNIADSYGLVLMEAVKTAYCPGFNELINVAKSGKIGRIVDVEAAFTRLTPVNTREYEADIYNGSMLEFGSYGLLPVIKFLGYGYENISYRTIRAVNGTDIYTKAELTYPSGMATVKTGLGVKSEGQLLISGTNGYIIAPSPWWLTKKFYVRYEDSNRIEEYNYPFESTGLKYELAMFLYNITEHKSSDTSKEEGYIGLQPQDSIVMAGIMEDFLSWNTPLWKSKHTDFKKIEQRAEEPKIWAHRGCSMNYPENTIQAFLAAARLPGITGIELDVQFTKDRQIVVFHDENVSRVTNGSKNVCDYTLEELKSLKVCNEEMQIPTLQEVLIALKPFCIENSLLINIELKTSVIRYEGIEQETHNIVKNNKMEKYVIYSSFLPESVAMMKNIAPECESAMLAVSFEDCINKARQTKADALHPYVGGMNCELPKDMQGMAVRGWNVDEPFYKDGRVLKDKNFDRFKAYGVTDIITNVPEIYLSRK